MTTNALTVTDQLSKTTKRSSLDELVAAKTKRSLLLLDVSGSMDGLVEGTARKIDKLRNVVDTLLQTHPVPMAAFGISGSGVELVERIPEPSGLTPLHKAIAFGRVQEANHLVVVTDGEPDSKEAAFEEARKFGGPIDVFFVGVAGAPGAAFCAELARRTGGSCGVTDLTGEPKKLAAGIAGLLGEGGL
jgi:hypothetical protein